MGFDGAPPEGPAAAEIKEFYDSGEFSGKALEVAVLHHPGGLSAKRLVLAGGGKRDKFDAAELRKLTGAVVRSLKAKGIHNITLALDEAFRSDDFAAAAVEGALLADLRKRPLQNRSQEEREVRQIRLRCWADPKPPSIAGAFSAKPKTSPASWRTSQPNVLTPMVLADHAKKMASEYGLECEVLDQDRMRQLGMGALLGVAQGSAEPPALIVIRYKPANAPTAKDHLGLIGKGVTFDTGGISIKPSDGMEKMRYDMSGGAAVIGAMRAIAQLKPAIPVTALIPAVENMPGSKAQRPGDIVKSLSGKTVEVLNTDAEGRLILIDALTYAQRLGCTHLVDAATLTGAIVVALGNVNIGAFTNNEAFLEKLLAASKAEGEKTWPMPMDEEYKELLKSSFADLHNIGGRSGGSITAAWFIRDFVDETPWVHLDIAGTAWLDDAKPYMAKGPTGVGLRTFVRLAETW